MPVALDNYRVKRVWSGLIRGLTPSIRYSRIPNDHPPAMSRTHHTHKPPGYEYWSKRPSPVQSPGRAAKRATHRAERREALMAVRDPDAAVSKERGW